MPDDLQWPIGRFSCAQFDFNFLASPNLWTNSDGRQMFGGLQKSGVYTAVYTDTMERAWQATLGLPCFGCNLSSTAVDENGIYVAVTGGNLYSLDRDTGAVQWATPLTGSFRYNGVAVANGVVYSLNDAAGTLQAFDASNGAPLFAHPFSQDTGDAHARHGQLERGVGGAQHGVRDVAVRTAPARCSRSSWARAAAAERRRAAARRATAASGRRRWAVDRRRVIATGPGAASYGYLTPVVTITKGGKVSYINADAVRHNVASTDGLFRSELADTGETVPVAGTEKLEPGTYQFLCEPHPGMKGQLIVR